MALVRSSHRLLQLRDLSPFVRKELRFDKFPRHPGGGRTLAALVGANVCVWAAWQHANWKALEGDERMLAFLGRNFVGTNQGMSEVRNLHRIILPSFSHEDFGHLVGNMTAMLLLAPRLHEFLGRARFLGLYAAGAVGGTLATQLLHLDPSWEAKMVREMPKRYQNILDDCNPGQALGLGASDAISAMFACFYFLFPRQPIPFVWMKTHLVWSLMPKSIQSTLPFLGTLARRSQAAAIWVLPMFFFTDFVEIWRRLMGKDTYESGLLPTSNTGHAAHVGGFIAGTLYYALVAHPLKAKYFQFTREEMLRRAYLMTLSLSFWYVFTGIVSGRWREEEHEEGKKVVFVLTYDDNEDKGKEKAMRPSVLRTLEQVWESNTGMRDLVVEANRCSIRESCSKEPRDGRSGVCDEHYAALRTYLECITTAPRSMAMLLEPQFFDSVAVCRSILREVGDDDIRKEVHSGYRELSPAISDLELILQQPRFLWGILPTMVRAISQSGPNLLRNAGMKLEETSGEVRLASVCSGGAADLAGASAQIGNAVTHVNGTAVSTLRDVHEAIQAATRAHFWFEERAARNTAASSAAPQSKASPSQHRVVQATDLERWLSAKAS